MLLAIANRTFLLTSKTLGASRTSAGHSNLAVNRALPSQADSTTSKTLTGRSNLAASKALPSQVGSITSRTLEVSKHLGMLLDLELRVSHRTRHQIRLHTHSSRALGHQNHHSRHNHHWDNQRPPVRVGLEAPNRVKVKRARRI